MKRTSKLEAELETVQERIGGFRKQREQMAGRRIKKLSEAFSGDWDIGTANRALRETIKTLEFLSKHGLSIQWHDGPARGEWTEESTDAMERTAG